MSINSYQREIYASHLAHGERRNHKYLYKEGDRYIYPEDLKGDHDNQFKKISAVDKNKKVIEARKKWLGSGSNTQVEGGSLHVSKNSSAGRANEKAQLKYSVAKTPHEGAKAKASAEYKVAIDKAGKDRDEYIKARKQAAYNNNASLNSEKQRKSAHAGYEADKKAFPEGGSTEELEEQKRKTKARKTVKRTQETIDKMRKRHKK